jgi:hypothetical protein
MLDYVLRQPDALALVLLVVLVGLTVVVGFVAARRGEAVREASEPGRSEMVSTWPHLLRRELIAALATLLVVSWWAIGFRLPLGPPADPSITPALAKAPWFFVGVQEMLQYFDAWLAGAVLPLLMLVGLCALPYLDVSPEGNGQYTTWRRRPVALTVVGGLLVMWLLPMVVGELLRGEHWALQPVWRPPPVETPLPPVQLLSLSDRLGLGAAAGQILGGALCLGPYLALAFLWRPLRRRSSLVDRMGRVRFALAGGLLLTALGVAVKVLLVAALDLRYLWVNSWFRI